MPEIEVYVCECEHEAHFDRNKRTPMGNPAHRYGAKYAARIMATVTVGGGCAQTMNLCEDCREDCHHA